VESSYRFVDIRVLCNLAKVLVFSVDYADIRFEELCR
jgi:hypothetical protein